MTEQPRRVRAPRGPVDASMSLINEVTRRPLDPGYAAEAETRERAGRPRSSGTRTPAVFVTALVIGFLVVVAALSLRVPTTAAAAAKQRLIEQIQQRQEAGDRQAATIASLRADVQEGQQEALRRGHQPGVAQSLTRTERQVGAVPLQGPGMELTVDDAPAEDTGDGDTDPRSAAQSDAGRVTSGDLQIIVNGLWVAGAEAISINGQRLTAQSAIRFAGQAILVNFRPLTRPYVITALGDPDSMPGAFAKSRGGTYLDSLRRTFGIQASVRTDQSLQVPASASLQLREATPAPTATGSTGGTGTATTATPTDKDSP